LCKIFQMANIIVTGAGSGIGRELCRYLLESGAHTVTGISRSRAVPAEIQAAVCAEGAVYHHYPMDITRYSDIRAFREWLVASHIVPDGLVNNAGMMLRRPFEEITPKEAEEVLQVNFLAPFMLIQDLLPLMPRGSHVVNITSMGGVNGSVKFSGLSIYSASKGALSVLTEVLAEELKERDIRVNALALGAVQTPMLEKTFPGYQAPVLPREMAKYTGDFVLTGHRFFNGKVLQVAVTTP